MDKSLTIDELQEERRLRQFARLAENYNLIPLDGKVPLNDMKWKKWQNEQRPFNKNEYREKNAGVICGPISGLIVVDVDSEELFPTFCQENNWEMPDTFTVQTGKQGMHLYYRYPDDGQLYKKKAVNSQDGSKKRIFDILGHGSYAVAPGSIHPETQNEYEIINDIPVTPAPQFLLDFMLQKEKAKNDDNDKLILDWEDRYIAIDDIEVGDECKKHIIEGAPKGQRSELQWTVLLKLLRAGYNHKDILAIFRKFAIGEKAREQGAHWLCEDIDRAEQHLANDNRHHQKIINKLTEKNILELINYDEQRLFIDSTRNISIIQLKIGSVYQTYAIRSDEFTRIVKALIYDKTNKIANTKIVNGALDILDGMALCKNRTVKLQNRITRYGDKIYWDLGDPSWQVIEIDAQGYRVVSEPPIPMLRSDTILPIPYPLKGGSLDDFRKVFGLPDDERWILIRSWLFGTLNPTGPYFGLNINGPAESGKSTLAELLHRTVDNSELVRGADFKQSETLYLLANSSHIISSDNLDGLNDDIQNALCRVITGVSKVKRTLYSDYGLSVLKGKNPVILNGINNSITRSDLASRFINIELPEISIKKLETDIYHDFNEIHPMLVGCLCSGISAAVKNENTNYDLDLPRMADAADWITRGEEGLGVETGEFLNVYNKTRISKFDNNISTINLEQAMLKLSKKYDGEMIEFKASELLDILNNEIAGNLNKSHDWPKGLTRLTPCLKKKLKV